MNDALASAIRRLSVVCFFMINSILAFAQPCECANCPLPITDNGSFDGLLDVTVNGPNDLDLCPLEQVCFTIDHTWIGDLSISLTSPAGLNYLVMADANNASGGCGTNEDDVDVCIEIGSANPLTGGAEYICNNGGGGPCLIGVWNVPCGATDPFGGAIAAPNCDLNDFNIPGDPANGTWALSVNDVCAQDIGTLITWSLVFGCGVIDCILCEADGGTLNQPDVTSCQFDPSLNLSVSPDYGSGVPPSATDYGYAYVVTDLATGLINSFQFNTNFSVLPVGDYSICGLSYAFVDAGIYPTYIGSPYADLEADLALLDPVFCGNLSTNCFELVVAPVPTPGMEAVDLCIGDCYTYNAVDYCNPGLYPVMITSYLGCDSLVNLMISPLSDSNVFIEGQVCPGETLEIGGSEYPVGNHYLSDVAYNGCDSTTTIIITEFYVAASTSTPPPITCTNPSVIITSSGSFGSSFIWYDEDGNQISSLPAVEVFDGGCYDLVVSRDSTGISCSDTTTVCVAEIIEETVVPVLTGPTEICFGDTITINASIVPDYQDYTWVLPPGVEVLNGGDGFPIAVLVWNSPNTGAVCVVAEGSCGPSLPGCLDIGFSIALAPPAVSGMDQLCPSDIADYVSVLSGSNGFNWSLIGDGTILSGQGTDTVSVQWNSPGVWQICANGLSDCGSGPTTCFPVLVNATPAAPILSGPSSFCDLDTLMFTAQAFDPLNTGFSWDIPACASVVGGNGVDTLLLLMNEPCDSIGVCVTSEGVCGFGASTCAEAFQIADVIAGNITGNQTLCLGNTETYQVPLNADAINYQWFVLGGDLLSGQGSNEIDVLWTDSGVGSICLDMYGTCNVDSSACLEVYVLPEVDSINVIGADIVCDGSIVDYTVENPDTLINSFVWSSTCGLILSGQGSASVEIDWTGCPTGGEVCVYGSGDCSDSPLYCFDVTGGTIPGDPVITGADTSCVAITDIYCGTSSDASLYSWTVVGGTIIGSTTDLCAEVSWEQSGVGQVCLVTENGCGSSMQTCYDVVLGDAPPVPDIQGSLFSCINEVQSYSYTIASTNIISVEWSIPDACGSIISDPISSNVDVEWLNAGDCEVCIRVENSCGFGPWLCESVFVQALPNPDAGTDDEVCGLDYNLSATVGTGLLSWDADGPGNVVFSNVGIENPTINVSIPGVYSFILEEDISGCIGSDTVLIQFNEEPTASSIVEYVCNGSSENYHLSIEMLAGSSPYTINGISGTWSGQVFTSDFIPSASGYSVEIFDAKGCGPVVVEGTHTCPCISDVGQFADTTYLLCVDETLDLPDPTGLVLDDNDVLSYIITTVAPNSLDLMSGLIEHKTDNIISFLPGMIENTTYYLTALVGNELLGLADLNDACVSVSTSVKFSFTALPNFSFATPGIDLCFGEPVLAEVSIQHANCADVKLDFGNGLEQDYVCLEDGDLISLPLNIPGNYTVTVASLSNENGCTNSSLAEFEVNIQAIEEVLLESDASVCNSTETGMTTQIDLSDYIISSTSNSLIWKDITGCPFSGNLPIIDLQGVSPGQYTFSCEVDPLVSSCISAPVFIVLTVEDCDCPELDVLVPGDLCNSAAFLELNDLIIDNTVVVDWNIISEPGTAGYAAASLTGSMLDLTNSAPGVYQLGLEFTGSAPLGCVLTNSLQVQLSDQLEAGISLGVLEFCFESGDQVALDELLQGSDVGGIWTEESVVPSIGNAFSAIAGTFDVQTQNVGLYNFRYSVDSEDPCLDNATDVFVRVNANPIIDMEDTGPLTCTNPLGEISTLQQSGYSYQWLFGGFLVSEDYSVEVDSGGSYELIVIDEFTFCESKGSVFIDSYQETPVLSLDFEDVICHNQATGVVEVDNTSGGEGPYVYSLNGGDFTMETVFDNLVAGTYEVVVEDLNGCIGVESVNLVNPDPLEISVDLDYSIFSNGFIGVGDSIQIDAVVNTSIGNIQSVIWSPSYLVDCDTCLTVYAYPEFTTNVSVEVTAGGCSAYENMQLLVRKDYDVFVPNVVSANNDGENDIFFIQGGDKVQVIRDFEVFDRWGSLMFRNSEFLPNDSAEGWDGIFKGEEASLGVYVYKFEVEFIDGRVKQYHGSVSLVR